MKRVAQNKPMETASQLNKTDMRGCAVLIDIIRTSISRQDICE